MNSNSKLSYAIAAILSGTSMGAAHAATATAAATASSDSSEIQEITVTAQRRTENMQDVPITIQALTADTLKELSLTTFDDFIKYLPNVTQNSFGPGQSNIYMRGLSLSTSANSGPGTSGSIPNVAVYLDDQSASFPGHNLDVYAADFERIEVLEGPQGTLFGSGAQAGVLRYITNKPKLDVTEGAVNAGYSYTAHGDPNTNVDATLNLPLIPDTLAVRGVIYDESRGGYINNVPSTFTRSSTDLGIQDFNGGVVPAKSVVINNANTVANAQNPVSYKGMRLSILGKLNEDWNAVLTQSYQQMDAQGVFYEMPYGSEGTQFTAASQPIGTQPLPHLSVTTFEPSYDKDKFENTALTVNGKVGDLRVVYNGSYLVRNFVTQSDYTNYARGVFGSYYQCAGLNKTAAGGTCYSPAAVWKDSEKGTHETHEVRLSTPDDWRIRGIAGVFYDKFVITDQTEWLYKTVPTCTPANPSDCFNNIGSTPGAFTTNPPISDSTAFYESILRTVAQKAAFGSVDVDLIPKTLTLTLGTRYYHFNEEELGQTAGSFYCKQYVPTTNFGPCNNYLANLNADLPNSVKYTGFKSRANISYKVTDDVLVYYTWSQGFRPGSFNRTSYHVGKGPDGVATFFTPKVYAPDSLTNNELGFKSLLLNRRLEVNGTVYNEDWKQVQTQFFDPQAGLGNNIFTTNGPEYQVRGGELQIIARITDGLTVQGSSSYNKSKLINSPSLINNNPASAGFGQPLAIPNVYGVEGTPLANSPLLQFNIRVRDEFPLLDYKAFWQVGAQHIGNSLSGTGNVVTYDQPGYTTYDASLGVAKDAWNVQMFAQNLTSVNASGTTYGGQFVEAETVIRPRVAGVKFGYKF